TAEARSEFDAWGNSRGLILFSAAVFWQGSRLLRRSQSAGRFQPIRDSGRILFQCTLTHINYKLRQHRSVDQFLEHFLFAQEQSEVIVLRGVAGDFHPPFSSFFE